MIKVLLQRQSFLFANNHEDRNHWKLYRPSWTVSSSKLCMSSSPSNNVNDKQMKDDNDKKNRRRMLIALLKTKLQNLATQRARVYERFRALSKKAQRVIVLQCLFFCVAFSGVVKNISGSYGPPSPIEISYSSFMDLIEQQQPTKSISQTPGDGIMINPNSIVANTNNIPVISNIRIGTDRYIYRLYPNPNAKPTSVTSTATTKTDTQLLDSATNSNNNNVNKNKQSKTIGGQFTAATLPSLPIFSSSSSSPSISLPGSDGTAKSTTTIPTLQQKRQQRQQQRQLQRLQRSPYIPAYTRPIPSSASSDLIATLRTNGLSFSALPVPKASVLAVTVRSVMVIFYFLILLRLYKTISGGGAGGIGGGKGDVPGKLASNDIMMAPNGLTANFDDIQGIDDAKQEVMELVDALRYPEKYAILGARAPTGLLLEGPPGTGMFYILSLIDMHLFFVLRT